MTFGAWLVERYGLKVVAWAALILVSLLFWGAAIAGYFYLHHQVVTAQLAAKAAQAETVTANQRAEVATATAAIRTRDAQAAQEALDGYSKNLDDDRPAVDRVVTRIVRDCAAPPGAGAGPRLPAPAGGADGAGAGAEDGGEGEGSFGQDLADDIQTCDTYLARYRALQRNDDVVSTPTTAAGVTP